MSNISVDYDILNQKQTPAFYASSLATRPAFGFPGRIFIDTDTPSSGIYRDTGSAWVQVADPGAGTTGTLQQVTTNGNTTTLGIQVQGIDINDGAGTGSFNTAIGTDALFSNTTGSSNTAIGYQSLPLNTTGNNNTGLGLQSLNANTTGGNNVAIGVSALNGNTTASNNTAIGYRSLFLNTTGANNTAIGQSSLTANTTGFSNVGIGSRALTANTTGAQNVAIGPDALYINTTGNTNTAIGTAALSLNTTGGGNTAIGVSALNSNTTANFNTAVGGSSLAANTTGTSNVAIGYLSLNANTTATGNTAIGSQSLYLNTTGGSNTAIGVGALQNNTTASTNTAIGSSALQNNSTGTQNTAIGSSALGLNTTAGDNTSIGFAAMQFNTTGTGNTAIGSSSLRANTTFNFNTALGGGALTNALASNNTAIGYGTLQSTTGANNTAIGLNSLQNNTTGIDNTAVGLSSLGVNTTGQYNAAFGRSSLNANTTGNFNTAIGSQALANITTGSQNIAIGYNSGGGITTGSSNTIIGTSVTGLPAGLSQNIILADGVGDVRLFSDANGLIGVNQAVGSTIGGQLDIHTAQTYALVLNGLTTNNAYTAFSNNSVGKWRIGNTYNAGANTFDIYNLGTSSNALSFNSTTNAASFNNTITATQFIGTGQVILNTIGLTTTSVYQRMSNSGQTSYFGIESSVGGDIITGSSAYATVLGIGQNRSLQLATNDSIRLTIAGGGNVLIGSTTDDTVNKLQVTGTAKFTTSAIRYLVFNEFTSAIIGLRSTDTLGNLRAISLQGNVVTLSTGSAAGSTVTDRLTIDATGITTISNLAGTGSRAVLADASGNLSAPVSDISVKENISIIGYGLNEILKMNPVWFNYNDEYKNYGEGRQNGNIAPEMEKVIPEAVFTTPSTGKMGINYDQLHAVYIKAIQELKAEIEALKNN